MRRIQCHMRSTLAEQELLATQEMWRTIFSSTAECLIYLLRAFYDVSCLTYFCSMRAIDSARCLHHSDTSGSYNCSRRSSTKRQPQDGLKDRDSYPSACGGRYASMN